MKNNLNKFELEKYENIARQKLLALDKKKVKVDKIPLYLIQPYFDYEKALIQNKTSNGLILEIGSGTGNFTNSPIKTEMNLIASDISPLSLKYLKRRYKDYKNLKIKIADVENLPFKDNYFDIVCGVGFLSYGKNLKTRNEIYRVLKKNGFFICVDSLNNNLIYRINRFFRYIFKNTSLETILKIPNSKLLKDYDKKFSKVEIKYYGSLIWLMPLFSLICGEKKATKILNYFDKLINVKNSAFRFLLIAKK